MKIEDRKLPPALPEPVINAVREPIHSALASITTTDEQLIVNDTRWLAQRASGSFSRCVMNSASFLSKRFEGWLDALPDWNATHEIDAQEIDAYGEINVRYDAAYLDEIGLRDLLNGFWARKTDFADLVRHYWPEVQVPTFEEVVEWLPRMYLRRKLHDVSVFPQDYHHLFKHTGSDTQRVRVGVEFETGYTASAYRSFNKLNYLYMLDRIDIGVFVATDKETAHRIWPASNRNVNWDELEQRNYRRNVHFPIWEITFAPDGYSDEAPHLAADGSTYFPEPTGEVVNHAGQEKAVFTRGKDRLIKE